MDIDVDCEGSKRQQIIHALKLHYGEDKVLNVCTYGTEGAKSSIKMAARGLGIPDTEAQYLGSFVKTERGSQWSLSDMLYGNKDKDREADKQFKKEMEKHPNLIETALGLEGMITRRGIHAGGVVVFNEDAYKNNAIMTAGGGKVHVTQFNLADTEYLGGVKFDILSVENLDRIRATLDLLAKDELIDSFKSLKENFRDILHPKNLNLEDKTYFEMASSGEIENLFQFSTEIGNSSVVKVSPNSFEEFCAANSLMRLQSENGEQPIDKYIRHKNDIQLWYDEMKEWKLNDDEIKVLEKHLLHDYGINITQEVSMALSADPKISNFDVLEQNKLRKTIAKPKGAALEDVKSMFYSKGKEQGTRKELLDYVWNVQFKMQFSYSFSQLHVTAYSIIGIQNLELNRRFPRIYWQTACLNVDSDSNSTDTKDIDYEKIANGIGSMKKSGVHVRLPSINKSDLSFTPDVENGAIIYGLKPVKSLNSKIVEAIIRNRPYTSLEDVLTKLYDTKEITTSHLINIVKSGMLDEFGERQQIMMDVIRYITDTKTDLTMQNIKLLLEADILAGRPEKDLVILRESIKNKVIRKEKEGKSTNKILKVTDMETYDALVGTTAIVNVTPNYYEVSEKEFKKYFDKQIKDLKEWLKTDEPVQLANRHLLNQAWMKHALGNYSSWEMETLSFYYHEHEMSHVPKEMYLLKDFSELPEEPVIVDTFNYNDRQSPKYDIVSIAGTVIAKNAPKHIVTILATDGSVVNVKYHGGAYSFYDKTVKSNGKVAEKSWFTKGNKLILTGFRRGGQFVAKKYKDTSSSTTTKLVTNIDDEGILTYKLERELM